MSRRSLFFRVLLKQFLALAAILNLIALFVFDYKMPHFLTSKLPSSSVQTEAPVQEPGTDMPISDSLQIQVPQTALIYDGSGPLNLLDGVSVLTALGETSSASISSTLKAGNQAREKIIEYSVIDDSGKKITAERILTLGANYSGPHITVSSGELSSLSESDLPDIASLMEEEGLLSADDGFGNDITSSVTSKAEPTDNAGEYDVTFTVVNLLNDTYSTVVSVITDDAEPVSGPVLTLNQSHVTIEAGEYFEYLEYIESAQAEDGSDLFHSISVNGSVDTSIPGEYELEIYCTDDFGNTSPAKTLTVTVE